MQSQYILINYKPFPLSRTKVFQFIKYLFAYNHKSAHYKGGEFFILLRLHILATDMMAVK